MKLMDEDDIKALQDNNQVKRYAVKILRRWPYILGFFLISMLAGYAFNRYATPIYQVSARISTKKFSGKSTSPIPGLVDASFFLSNIVEVYEEIPILLMPKRFEEALKKVDLRVRYYSTGWIKTRESAYGVNFLVSIDTINKEIPLPYGVPIYVNQIDESSFNLRTDDNRWKSHIENVLYKFKEPLQLGGATLTIQSYKNIDANDKYFFTLSSETDLVREYLNKLQISWAMKGSAMLDLHILSETPDREVKFLQAYFQAVEELGMKDKNETLDNTLSFIDKQMETITDSIVYYQELMDAMRLDNRRLSGGSDFIFSRLNELDKQRAEIILKENYFEYLGSYFKNKSSEEVFAPSMVGLDIQPLETWVSRYAERRLTEKYLRNESNSRNPLLQRDDSLNRRLELGIMEAMRSARERNRAQLNELKRQEDMLFQSVQEVQADFRMLSRYQRLYELNQTLFDLLIRRKIEVDISKASATSDYHIIDQPGYSRNPISPEKDKNLLMAAAIGLFLPIMMFLFKDLTNTRIIDKEDLIAQTAMPLLGNVAHSSYNTNQVVKEYPRSVTAESFRSLRANLRYLSANVQNRARTFVVTSSVGGEGKTFCSLNLAFTLAMSGKRTIIIGADMRKPELGNYSGTKAQKGLSDYLASFAERDEVILPGDERTPDMIDAGHVPPNPSELLGLDRMQELMSYLQQNYDYVLIDTPPIGLVSDAMELFKYSDYNILIVRQGETRKAALKMVNELYIEDKLNNFSVVFNDIELIRSAGSYYGSYVYGLGYSGYGYGYYEGDKVKKGRRKG